MRQENRKQFTELLEQIKDLFEDNCTSVKLTITGEGTKLEEKYKHKRSGGGLYPLNLKGKEILVDSQLRSVKGT